MILQSKAHFENWIVSLCRFPAESAHQLDERDRVGKRINRLLMGCSQMIGGNTRAVDLPAQRNDACIISHGFSRGLRVAIGDRRSHCQIIESAPFRERNLESTKQRAEECDATL